MPLRTNIYIDGFNLYYSAVRGTSYKWLDLSALCHLLFPNKNIQDIKYFSAKVKASKHDSGAPTRQNSYWRALKTIKNLEIIEGNFVRWPRLMPQFPLAYINNNYSNPPQRVQVERTEEKGSDVNLATHLLYDNCINATDESVVISNDADLVLPIEIVTTKLNKVLIVVNPNRTRMVQKFKRCRISRDLKRVATSCVASINESVLVKAQFQSTLSDSMGQFTKPNSW